MNKKLLAVITAIVILGIASQSAFGTFEMTSNGTDDRGVYFMLFDYECRNLGKGEIRYYFFSDDEGNTKYVYVEQTREQGGYNTIQSRIFSEEDWRTTITKHYINTYGLAADKC